MTDRLTTGRAVYLDTSYALALVNSDDILHEIAEALAEQLEEHSIRIVTSRAILLEIGDGLSKPGFRRVAGELLKSVAHDPLIEVVELDAPLYEEALSLYQERPDKGWGLTDCVSFTIMTARGIQDALTHDIHFEQAGFKALLRGPA